MFFFDENIFTTKAPIRKLQALAKFHLIMGFKARSNRREVSVFSFDHAGWTWQEPLNSFLMHETHQDVIEHLDGFEMLKILCGLPCLEINANALKECMNMKSFSKHWSHLVTSKF